MILPTLHPRNVDPFVAVLQTALLGPLAEDYLPAVARFKADPATFFGEVQATWKRRDLRRYVTLGRVLRNHRHIDLKNAERLVYALSAIGRHAEAIALARDPRMEDPQSAAYQAMLARLLASSGALQEGRRAAARGVELDPALPAAIAIAQQLQVLHRLQERPATFEHWSKLRALVEALLALGQPREALHALTAFLARAPHLKSQTLGELGETACQVLIHLEPEQVPGLLAAMRLLPLSRREAQLLAAAVEIVLGDDPDARLAPVREGDKSPAGFRNFLALACAQAGRLEAAIEQLGGIATRHPHDMLSRTSLARCVSLDTVRKTRFWPQPKRPRRIFDVFPFSTEDRMLKLKLAEMGDWVDKFVLVESRETFTGLPKKLLYRHLAPELEAWRDKIIQVTAPPPPAYVTSAWAREFYQRDAALAALGPLMDDDDLVLITDADEIIDRRAVADFSDEAAALRMRTFRFFLNLEVPDKDGQQGGLASVWRGRYVRRFGLSLLRNQLPQVAAPPRTLDAGWHFTSAFDAVGIVRKLHSYSHQENVGKGKRRYVRVLENIRAGHINGGLVARDLDEQFPRYLREHRDEFADLIL